MEEYVYKHLEKFGNTVIHEKVYEKMREEAILKDLKEHGFDCVIKIYTHEKSNTLDMFNLSIPIGMDVIIEVKS